jgi:sec-independent protein translocase protein TatB
MFGMSAWHLAVLLLVGLFVFGPERLPNLLRDLGKALRQVRRTAQNMQEDLQAELGPEVGDLDLSSLHPRTFVEKHLFGDEEDPMGLDFLSKDAKQLVSFDKPAPPPEANHSPSANGSSSNGTHVSHVSQASLSGASAAKWDADAT